MLEISKLNVLNDNVLVEAVKPAKRGGVARGISVDNKPEIGTVLKVGPGRILESGTLNPTTVKPKMLVLFNQHTTTKFNIEGTNYYVLREEDIIGFQ